MCYFVNTKNLLMQTKNLHYPRWLLECRAMAETSTIFWQTQYEDGIALGRSAGVIRDLGVAKEDFFSHLERGLDGSNTRPLRATTRAVVLWMQKTFRRNAMRCLELGPGCGRAAGELRTLLGNDLRLETVGRTPFNPYLQLRMDVISIGQEAERILSQEKSEAGARMLLEPVRGAVLGMKLGTLMELQNNGLVQAFQEHAEPFVNLQHIGEFSEFDDASAYDLVHEDNGPFRHTQDMRADFAHVLDLTADHGICILSPFTNPEQSERTQAMIAGLEHQLRAGDVLRVLPNTYRPSNSDLLIARADSALRPLLAAEAWRERMQELLRAATGSMV